MRQRAPAGNPDEVLCGRGHVGTKGRMERLKVHEAGYDSQIGSRRFQMKVYTKMDLSSNIGAYYLEDSFGCE